MYTLGVSTTVPSAATVALLPNTGAYHPVFVAAVAVLVLGLTILAVSGVVAVKQHVTRG